MPNDAPGATVPDPRKADPGRRAGPDAAPGAATVPLDSGSTRLELRTWRWALAFFLIAAATGAWMRFGLAFGWPPLLRFDHMRHAHSHLMFFGWVTPVLFAGIAAVVERAGVRMRGIGWLLAGTFAAAAAAYPTFLASGYRLAHLFARELPLSMAAAGFSGVAWIAFGSMYVRARRRMRGTRAARDAAALAWFDAAVFLLAASLLGIAGLAAGGMLGASEPRLTGGLVDFFLALFGEGWFGAAVLGLAHAAAAKGHASGGEPGAAGSDVPALAFATGTLVWTTAELGLAIAERPVAPAWLSAAAAGQLLTTLAAVGHLAVGAAVVWACVRLLRNGSFQTSATGLWIPALAFLAAKGLVELGYVLPATREAVGVGGLRVLLLHAFLLGAVSIALVAAWTPPRRTGRACAGSIWPWVFVGAVILLLVGLLPLAGWAPWLPPGRWTLQLAAVTSLGPLVAAVGLWAVAPREPT